MKKINKVEILLVILVLIVIAAGLLLPKTGELVLLDELCNSSVLWIVCVYVVVKVVRNKASGQDLLLCALLWHSGFLKILCLIFRLDRKRLN